MSIKMKKKGYQPDVYIEPGSIELDATDPYDMDVRAAANQLALKGDVHAAYEYVIFNAGLKTTQPVTIPTVCFSKKGHADMEVSQNNHALIDALTKSGWKVT